MLTNQAAGITTSAASLSAIASSIGAIILWQLTAIQNLLTMIISCRNLSSRYHIIISTLHLEHILSKLWQLASTIHAGSIYHARSQHLGITMLVGMQIHHKIYQGSLQASTQALVEGKSGTSNLGSTLSVQNAQSITQIPMSLWLKVKFGRLHKTAYLWVVILIYTNRNILLWHIRNAQHNIPEIVLYLL